MTGSLCFFLVLAFPRREMFAQSVIDDDVSSKLSINAWRMWYEDHVVLVSHFLNQQTLHNISDAKCLQLDPIKTVLKLLPLPCASRRQYLMFVHQYWLENVVQENSIDRWLQTWISIKTLNAAKHEKCFINHVESVDKGDKKLNNCLAAPSTQLDSNRLDSTRLDEWKERNERENGNK